MIDAAVPQLHVFLVLLSALKVTVGDSSTTTQRGAGGQTRSEARAGLPGHLAASGPRRLRRSTLSTRTPSCLVFVTLETRCLLPWCLELWSPLCRILPLLPRQPVPPLPCLHLPKPGSSVVLGERGGHCRAVTRELGQFLYLSRQP